MKRSPWIVLSGAVSLGMLTFVLAQAQPVVPAGDAQRIIDADADFLRGLLGKGELGRKTARQATSTAVLIAASADASATAENAGQMATLRDAALAVAEAIEKNDAGKAKELAAGLSSKIKADPAANPKNSPWPKSVKFDNVMRAFSSDRVGGLGLEAKLEALAEEKGPLSADRQKEIVELAVKSAVIAKIAEHYKPAADEGMGFNPQNWLKLDEQFRKNALALADAAKSNGNVAGAAEKLTASCVACHDIFR